MVGDKMLTNRTILLCLHFIQPIKRKAFCKRTLMCSCETNFSIIRTWSFQFVRCAICARSVHCAADFPPQLSCDSETAGVGHQDPVSSCDDWVHIFGDKFSITAMRNCAEIIWRQVIVIVIVCLDFIKVSFSKNLKSAKRMKRKKIKNQKRRCANDEHRPIFFDPVLSQTCQTAKVCSFFSLFAFHNIGKKCKTYFLLQFPTRQDRNLMSLPFRPKDLKDLWWGIEHL